MTAEPPTGIIKKIGIIVIFAVAMAVIFFATKSHYFERGLKVGMGDQALNQVGLNHMYKLLIDDERHADLNQQVELNMWLAIPELYEYTLNEDASEDDRNAGSYVLKRAVKYFYVNPHVIETPESLNLNEGVQKQILTNIKQGDVEDDLAETLQSMAPLLELQLDGISDHLDGVVMQFYLSELNSQAVFNSLVKRRYFPGKERNAGSITVMTPRGTGFWGGGMEDTEEFEFEFEKPTLKVRYDGGKLIVNGEDYGELDKNDIIDFRMPGHVYVNDQERKPLQ